MENAKKSRLWAEICRMVREFYPNETLAGIKAEGGVNIIYAVKGRQVVAL